MATLQVPVEEICEKVLYETVEQFSAVHYFTANVVVHDPGYQKYISPAVSVGAAVLEDVRTVNILNAKFDQKDNKIYTVYNL